MTQLRLDKVQLTNLLETYINYDTLKSNIVISGNIAIAGTATFSTTIPYTVNKTRADVYARNTTTGVKRPVTGGLRQSPYVPVSTETCNVFATYANNLITVTFSIFNNTGALLALTTQTIEISAVLYEVPTTT